MPSAQISFGAYQRTGNPTLAALNCYAEQFPTGRGPSIQMRARPGFSAFEAVGSNNFRAAVQKDGLFGGAALIVNGSTAYTLTEGAVATALTGSIAGSSILDADLGQDSNLDSVGRFATGSALYKVTEAGGVVLEDFPDVGGAGASSVCYHRGFWFAVEAGTDKVYTQIPGDVTWNALTFSSAEFNPDALEAVRTRGDQIALMGKTTFEVFVLSGTAADPIVPYGGLVFNIGCRSRTSAILCGDSLMFVDSECNVRRWDGGEPRIVSDPGLSEQIRSVSGADLRAWTYAVDGQRFYVLTLGGEATWVYSLTAAAGGDRWFTFASLGYDYWRFDLGCVIGGMVLACDRLSSQTYQLDTSLSTDGDDLFQKTFCAVVEGEDGVIPCGNVSVLCDIGGGPYESQGSEPIMVMRYSDNQGKTWTEPMQAEFATAGDYANLPLWNGVSDIPRLMGRIFEFSLSDPVPMVAKRVALNLP